MVDGKRVVLHILVWLIAIVFIVDQCGKMRGADRREPSASRAAEGRGGDVRKEPEPPLADPNAVILSGMVDKTLVEIQECIGSGSQVIVRGAMTNQGPDGYITFYAKWYGNGTVLYDDGGNRIEAGQIEIGNLKSGELLKAQLITGVQTKFSITFGRMATAAGQLQASKIKVLDIMASVIRGNSFEEEKINCKFRNVPIRKIGLEQKDSPANAGEKTPTNNAGKSDSASPERQDGNGSNKEIKNGGN